MVKQILRLQPLPIERPVDDIGVLGEHLSGTDAARRRQPVLLLQPGTVPAEALAVGGEIGGVDVDRLLEAAAAGGEVVAAEGADVGPHRVLQAREDVGPMRRLEAGRIESGDEIGEENTPAPEVIAHRKRSLAESHVVV